MDTNEFSREVRKKAHELRVYTESYFPSKAAKVALRFINGNFRAQGFQGVSFQKWKPNKRKRTILIKTGKLRAATYYTSQPGQFTINNPLPYAKIHNEGFQGTVTVKAHSRNKYSKTKVGRRTMTMKTGESTVKSHARRINMPRRQFIPTPSRPSPVLNNAILRMISKDLDKIMNL